MKRLFAVTALALLGMGVSVHADVTTLDGFTVTHTTAQLSQARYYSTSATIGDRAFVCGGLSTSGMTDAVDVYDSTTRQWASSRQGEVSPLSQARYAASAVSSGSRLFVAGGSPGGAWPSNRVDIFNSSGTRIGQTTISGAAGNGRERMASASTDGRVFFAGGETNWGADWMEESSDLVDMFDASTLSRRTMSLSMARSSLMGASVGHKALFAGGNYVPLGGNSWTSRSRVDIYDAQLDSWSTAELSVARQLGASATVGSKAIFAGGLLTLEDHHTYQPVSAVDIYDDQTGLWSTANLSQARGVLAGASCGSLAFFAGGRIAGVGGYSDVVDVYDSRTGTWSVLHLSQAREYIGATVVGNQVIFAGGSFGTDDYYSDVVDIFTLAPVPEPSSILALVAGLGSLAVFRRRRAQ